MLCAPADKEEVTKIARPEALIVPEPIEVP